MGELLRLVAVEKTYSAHAGAVHALKGVSLEVGSGEFLSLTGPSGCGKSTLLHIMGGMDQPTAGEVWLSGEPIHSLGEEGLTQFRRSHIGFVFQFFYLLPTMSVLENVELPVLLAGDSDVSSARELLVDVGLEQKLSARPGELSGGEMQRVAIARALMNDPRLVLADEPTGNLDSENGAVILDLLSRLARQREAAIVMATHSKEAAARTDRTIQLRDGVLVS